MAYDLTTPELVQKALELLEPDLAFLLEEKRLEKKVQAMLAIRGFKNITLFSLLDDGRDGIRTYCRDELLMDASANNTNRLAVACIIAAWEAAKERVTRKNKVEADAMASGFPKTMQKSDLLELKAKFEGLFYKLEDDLMPAAIMMEHLFEMVEENEYRALKTSEIISREEAGDETYAPAWDKNGQLRLKKGTRESQPPADSEQFRKKMRVLSHAFQFMKLKFPNKVVWTAITAQDITDHCDFILGEHILGLAAKNELGEVVSMPSWALVMSYEQRVRKLAASKMNEGTDLQKALKEARIDGTTKERYFTTPTSMASTFSGGSSNRSRSRGSDYWSDNSKREGGKGGGREKSKGGGKGKKGGKDKGGAKDKGKGGGVTWHTHTPDGQSICFSWNNPHERCRGACGRVHCCRACFGKHPVHMCKPGLDSAAGTFVDKINIEPL
jgi:hypothetical protein